MSEDTEDFEREERAFAEALHAAVPVESFRPLDAEAIKAAARPARPARTRWMRTLAAAAVLVVTVGVGAALLPRMSGSASTSAVPEAPGYGAGGSVPEAAQDRGSAAANPDAAKVTTGEWSNLSGSPLAPRSYAGGAWLAGRYYLVGGQLDQPCPPNASCLAPSRLLRDGASYDPGTGTWQAIADAPVSVSGAAVPVGSTLYFTVWIDGSPSVYGYDTSADTWTRIPSPSTGGGGLVAAGERLVSIAYSDERGDAVDEAYDTATGTWSRLPNDPLGRSFNRGAVWVNGKLLLLAHRLVASPGSEEPSFVRLAEFDFATSKWRRLPDSEVLGGGVVAVAGLVVFTDTGSADGGEVNNWGRSYPMGGIYDPT
ncbi:MAG TPA: hypothetical protein VFW55_10615, partial [Propionicimonas sp.]|nr:hypothetical protein [Propionicimonas sp.]